MSEEDGKHFRKKHPSHVEIDPTLRASLLERAGGGELSCAVAFDLAGTFRVSPEEVGRAADLLELALVKCQLGLFGYRPVKKIVKPADAVTPELKQAIQAHMDGDLLPCKVAWEIGNQLGLHKMKVSAACENMGVKIKPCQLGAF